MKPLYFVFLFASVSAAQINISNSDSVKTNHPRLHDSWFAKDKIDHFTTSALLTGFSYYFAYKECSFSEEHSKYSAVSFSITTGALKEIYDKVSGKGTPSWKDFAADILGTGLCYLIISTN